MKGALFLVLSSCAVALSCTDSYQNLPAGLGCFSGIRENYAPNVCATSGLGVSLPYASAVNSYPTSSYNLAPAVSTSAISEPLVVEEPTYARSSNIPGSDSCGPTTRIGPIRYLNPVVLPAVNEPIRQLPSPPLPPPTVISNKCVCTKVVQKPQLYQRIIQVQKNQRFLKKSIVPRVEKVSYCAKPRC